MKRLATALLLLCAVPVLAAPWVENIPVTMTDTTPAHGATSSGDIDVSASGYDVVVIQFTFDWGASSDRYLDIFIYSSSDGGTTVDDVPIYNRRVDATPNGTTSVSLQVIDYPWLRVAVDNRTTGELANLVVEYAGKDYRD